MLVCIATPLWSAERLKISSPVPHQVFQRTGIAPGEGEALVLVAGAAPSNSGSLAWSWRVVATEASANVDAAWQGTTVERDGDHFRATVRIPAGGWYRLELRGAEQGAVQLAGAVEPIGIGEVFLIAGQSYATNTNDERRSVTDQQQRVVAYDSATDSWRVANDPQPTPDGSDGGSIWPPLGDALADELQMPIAFANVAWGGTTSRQWLPGESLYERLVQTGQKLGRFRGVLWQQGESDVIEKTPTLKYVENLVEIRGAAARTWEFEPCWLLAKSTHHPTVYLDPEGEDRIRAAIDNLVERPGFCAGPDTDTLQGENRGDINSRRHFSAIGQTRAAELWRTAIRQTVLADD
jgi:hypothetical protein